MRQFTAAAFAVFLLLVSSAGQAVASTEVVNYNPAHMQVARTVSGSCWTSSIAAQRPDAFRCTSGNEIYDPCFTSAKGQVRCPTDLRHNRGTLIDLTSALPSNTNVRSGEAWAFELATGGMCVMGTGTVSPGFPFYCTAPPVCSEPKRSGNSSSYETMCGKPTAPIKVGSVRGMKVVRIWK